MADLIDRQAAIDEIDEWIKAFRENGHKESAADARLIQDGIIQLPSAQPDVSDTTFGNMISRQAAIDAVRSYYDECDEREESIEERIERLLSADIDLSGFSDRLWKTAYERGKAEAVRHGKWLEHKDYPGLAYLCSECNLFTTDRSYYCPHCGALMDEVAQ